MTLTAKFMSARAKKGGHGRARSLSRKRRVAIARKAANVRWGKA